MTDVPPKAMRFSRVMSAMGFTGFYFPFTGECNVNVDFPAATLPSTVAHELSHRRGIASEQECNFRAVLACLRRGGGAGGELSERAVDGKADRHGALRAG